VPEGGGDNCDGLGQPSRHILRPRQSPPAFPSASRQGSERLPERQLCETLHWGDAAETAALHIGRGGGLERQHSLRSGCLVPSRGALGQRRHARCCAATMTEVLVSFYVGLHRVALIRPLLHQTKRSFVFFAAMQRRGPSSRRKVRRAAWSCGRRGRQDGKAASHRPEGRRRPSRAPGGLGGPRVGRRRRPKGNPTGV
jgi:hypothetical protein